ncbi:Rha family transcriptional regulator [Paenibacillus rhizophilus]|uniref:Rha family transcriptional regulator n=1 Tax=Paenibacillus rhizophilus TaxID=1850366 RepID=A0A3N9PU47_9BACL|nr:Rha family transcriptional regulator [Paenibacillus rhizophilus]RQW09932.1 Rha family transcriptional regulator [Paenibacillus rhizophilus]
MDQLLPRAFTIDSREVAEMLNIRHADLLEKIEAYILILENGKFRSADFFIESSYTISGSSRLYKCFDVTKKGCDMVANKTTGEKGVLFTAAYVTRFEEYEKNATGTNISELSPLLQILIQTEQRQKQIEQRQDNTDRQLEIVKETFLQRDENWRGKIKGLLNGAAYRRGKAYREIRSLSYEMLEDRAHCDLARRLTNLKERLRESGATKTKIDEANRLDVIEAEPRLKEIYYTIVKELSIGTMQ